LHIFLSFIAPPVEVLFYSIPSIEEKIKRKLLFFIKLLNFSIEAVKKPWYTENAEI